jgi:uncharacterized membrane protein (DUF485 family)
MISNIFACIVCYFISDINIKLSSSTITLNTIVGILVALFSFLVLAVTLLNFDEISKERRRTLVVIRQ